MTPQEFKALLDKEVLIIDGGFGSLTQQLKLGPEAYGGEEFGMLPDILGFSRPDDVQNIHYRYYKAGASAVETNALNSSPLRLQEHDFSRINTSAFPPLKDGKRLQELSIEDISYRISRQAAELAGKAREQYKKEADYDGRKLLVLGNFGPSNWVLTSTQSDLKRGDFDQIVHNFYIQAFGMIDGGADVFLFETQQDALELKAAIFGAKKALKERKLELPIIAQVTVDSFAKMQLFNTSIESALVTLQDIGIDAFGINCGLGPEQMLAAVQKLSQYSKLPISVVPNAGLPRSEFGKTVYDLTPEEMLKHMKIYVEEYGVNIIGGCCGTTPDHIKKLSDNLKGVKPKARKVEKAIFVSGPQQAIKLDSCEALIQIGEQLNVRGSKKVREAVESSSPINQAALEEVVTELVKDLGLELIDVCMDSNIVDTPTTLVNVVKAQTLDFSGAMSLDSFDVTALEKAIKVYPGRPIINSISLEEVSPGVDKIDAVLRVTKDHAPVYIALTTGPKGPATTTKEKIQLARQIVEKTTQVYGIKPEQLFIDINAFPVGSESNDSINFAVESINAIPGIKAIHPDLKVSIGIGNLTNGLASKPYMRKVLTSVFLDEARKKGLDAALINPNHYVPVDSLPKEDYELGIKVILKHDMDAFAQLEQIALQRKGGSVEKKAGYDHLKPVEAICAKIKDGFKERSGGSFQLAGHSYSYEDKIVLQVAEVINDISPLDLINQHLMPAMDELGAGFADGTVSLPQLLKSADVMKQVMTFLEAYIKSNSKSSDAKTETVKGTVVIGTVYQDVHSIGKDLTKTLIENYGYRVVDLGVQVPLIRFIEEAKKHQAIAIGLSALLVQTSNHMITVSSLMKEQGLASIPLLIGGAPVNQRHAAFVAMAGVEKEDQIRDNVFYCRSGMDGVNYLNQLKNPEQKPALLADNKRKLIKGYQSGTKLKTEHETLLKTLPRRKTSFDQLGDRKISSLEIQKIEFSMKEFLPYINQKLLFSLNWKYGGGQNLEKKGLSEKMLQDQLRDWVIRVDKEKWIRPKAAFAIYPCKRKQNAVSVFDPKTGTTSGEFTFNDVIGKDNADIFNVAQYFKNEGQDMIGICLSSSGTEVLEPLKTFSQNDQESALMLQGLANRVAEDMAEYVNQLVEKKVFGSTTGASKRYSPGYPAMTEINGNQLILKLLDGTKHLGVELTEASEFFPTSTTGAVICFHPEAGYN